MKVTLWAEIHRLHDVEKLSNRQIAGRLHVSRKSVTRALACQAPPIQANEASASILDPYTGKIDALIDRHPDLSAVRVLEEIAKGQDGYRGEVSLVRRYLQRTRPDRRRIYQEVSYEPGSAMQLDWGECGTLRVGNTLRKVSVLVALLCYSRMLFIEFTLSQKKAFFYRAISHALEFFQGAPARAIVDNLKAAVLEGSGKHARFHPEFLEMCAYYRMEPVACEAFDPESKGGVEGGVRYVKHNALAGRDEELQRFEDYASLATYWRDQIANVRRHATTRERPVDRLETERPHLRALPAIPWDSDEIVSTIASPHCRVEFDTNFYSVPPNYSRKHVMVRADGERVRVVFEGDEVASHARCYDKRQRIIRQEDRELALARRRRSHAHEVETRFDALGQEAHAFRRGLDHADVKPRVHMRKILELVTLYGRAEVLEALEKASQHKAFDAAYVKNLIDQSRRKQRLPSALPITPKRRELIDEVDLDEPDPAVYDVFLQDDSTEDIQDDAT